MGVALASLLTATPAVLAANDDLVVYGEEFEDQPVAPPSVVENENQPTEQQSIEEPAIEDDDDEIDIGKVLKFDDITSEDIEDNTPIEIPIEQPKIETPIEQTPIDQPVVEPPAPPIVETPKLETPLVPRDSELVDAEPTPEQPTINETPIDEPPIDEPYVAPFKRYEGLPTSEDRTSTVTPVEEPEKSPRQKKQKKPKKIKARFVKLVSDDSFDYYLDKSSVQWQNMPYSTSEYMADVWIRMIEKSGADSDLPSDLYNYVSDQSSSEIADAAERGYAYNDLDARVLRTKKYFLEHYYIRPSKRQIQFLCELEVVGRPQNTISERAYDYKNWENLIPGSIETAIYYGVLDVIGTGKANSRGHMTAVDMLEEYARISIR